MELYAQGKSITQIGRIMFVHHEVIRNIVHGVYEKPKSNKARFRPSKFNWKEIDNNCLNRLLPYLERLRRQGNPKYTKKQFAIWLNLKDYSLRGLSRTNYAIKKYRLGSPSNIFKHNIKNCL